MTAGDYLDAFSDIERHLRRIIDADKTEPFYSLISRAGARNRIVERYADDLREFGDLRNAIVHERRDGQPIADPRVSVIEEIRHIRDLLLEPPSITDLRLPAVVTCCPDDSIGIAARHMREGDFSQLPVYSNANEWSGLLTAETIARWVSARLSDGIGIMEDEPVEAVLPHREPSSVEVFLPRSASVFDLVDAFHKAAESGDSLDAVIVTHSGSKREAALGILTVFDLPKAMALIRS